MIKFTESFQKKLEETLPEIKKLFEDILFTNKIKALILAFFMR